MGKVVGHPEPDGPRPVVEGVDVPTESAIGVQVAGIDTPPEAELEPVVVGVPPELDPVEPDPPEDTTKGLTFALPPFAFEIVHVNALFTSCWEMPASGLSELMGEPDLAA